MDARRVERCVALCAERAWRVAHALLRDPDEAFDAVQQAFLVAASKPEQIPEDDPWPWFAVVVAFEAKNLRRKRRPLTNRLAESAGIQSGGDMDVPDPRATAPSDGAEQADDVRRLRAAVDGLPPPEREALVLVHLGGMTHAGAAEALRVPRQTVTDRARRGLEAVSAQLRRDPLSATHGLAMFPIAAPPLGLEHATAAWTKAALSALGSVSAGGGAAVAAKGAFVMTSKTVLAVGLVVAAGVGFLGGTQASGLSLFASNDRAARAQASADAVDSASYTGDGGGASAARLRGTGDATASSASEVARLQGEIQGLATRLAVAEHALETERAAKRGPGAGAVGPTFTFGEMGRLAAVVETDWGELADSAKVVADSVVEIRRHREAGEEVPRSVQLALQENVERIRKYEYRVVDKMPTSARYNGELTHPISFTNLLAAQLARAGKPLSASQVAQIERLGLAFEDEYARLRSGWTPEVARTRRMLGEYRLKGKFTDDVWVLLTPEQRTTWIDPALRGIAGIDLYDPTLMVLHTSMVFSGATPADLRASLSRAVRARAGVAADAPSRPVDTLVDAFMSHVARSLEPVSAARAASYTYGEALVAGEASADLVDGLLRDMDLAPALRQALLDDTTWYVPRLVTS